MRRTPGSYTLKASHAKADALPPRCCTVASTRTTGRSSRWKMTFDGQPGPEINLRATRKKASPLTVSLGRQMRAERIRPVLRQPIETLRPEPFWISGQRAGGRCPGHVAGGAFHGATKQDATAGRKRAAKLVSHHSESCARDCHTQGNPRLARGLTRSRNSSSSQPKSGSRPPATSTNG